MMSLVDYWEAEFRVFPLWAIMPDGSCECGDKECEAIGKHPRVSSWQHTPHWSDEQIEVITEYQLKTGFGVCLDDHLVIDIDKRNGGWESYEKLKKDTGIDYEKESGFVVSTGGGGAHIYFSKGHGLALAGHHKDYKGIDFKSSGFVVGYGSLHRSGAEYERKKGFPQDLTEAPQKLLDLLKKKDKIRASIGTEFIDISEDEIREMLSFIDPSCPYDQWISIGMAIHDATQGTGVDIWDDWSSEGSSYDKDNIDGHWQSFGKCSNPVTIGTIIHYAEEAGFKQSVIFSEIPHDTEIGDDNAIDTSSVDLLRPPGFVGEVTQWINDQCRFPRERLAVGTALNVVGNIGGLRHYDDLDDITMNTMIFCIAASGSGKEAVQQAWAEIMRKVGISAAVHGTIKSEQEITRNAIRHQALYYMNDELGILLQKIENARAKGGASYLDGVVGAIMSIYTKANGHFLVGGDVKEDMRAMLLKELSMCEKKVSENEDKNGTFKRRYDHLLTRAIPSIDTGIENPFLSMVGYATPVTFDSIVTGETAANGFVSRAYIAREHETSPRRKKGFKKKPINPAMVATLKMMAFGGITNDPIDRVEFYGDKTPVHTTERAQAMLDQVADYFEEEAERQKSATGLEAIPRRGYELTAKISMILALGGKLRDTEHVRWAFRAAVEDCKEKLRLAHANILSASKNAPDAALVLQYKIMDCCGGDGERISVIKRRVGKKFKDSDTEMMIEHMIEKKMIEKVVKENGKRPSIRYKAL